MNFRQKIAVAIQSGNEASRRWMSIREVAFPLVLVGFVMLAVLHFNANLYLTIVLAGAVGAVGWLLLDLNRLYECDFDFIIFVGASLISAYLAFPPTLEVRMWLVLANAAAGLCVVIGVGSVSITRYFVK